MSNNVYESQRPMAWTRIYNEGNTIVARLLDPDAQTPVRPWLRFTPVMIIGILLAWTGAMQSVAMQAERFVSWTVAKAAAPSQAEPMDPQRDLRTIDEALMAMFAGSTNGEALPLTHENVKDVVSDQLKQASALSTTWKGAPIADDAMEVVKAGELRWLFAKIQTRTGPAPMVVVLRKHDGEWKAYSIRFRQNTYPVSGMPFIGIGELPLAARDLAAELAKAKGGLQ